MAETTNPKGGNPEAPREDDGGVVSARDRFQRLSQEVQGRYHQATDDVRRGAERAANEIRRGAETARRSAEEGYETVRRSAGDISRDVSYYVRDNPGKAMLMAAGVGFLIGLLVRRGRDEEAP